VCFIRTGRRQLRWPNTEIFVQCPTKLSISRSPKIISRPEENSSLSASTSFVRRVTGRPTRLRSTMRRLQAASPLRRLVHSFYALQDLASVGFPVPWHANVPPTENISALLSCRRILVHSEERNSRFPK
jgi:hypothetical protein